MRKQLTALVLLMMLSFSGVVWGQNPERPVVRLDNINTNPANWKTVAPGLEHLQLARGYYVKDDPKTGPWFINMLRVNPKMYQLEVRHALDEGVGLETVSDMARRLDAVAAINGGFFALNGSYRGDPVGALMMGGSLISEPWSGRTALGIVPKDNVTELAFSTLRWESRLRITNPSPDTPRPLQSEDTATSLSGINRPRGDNELLLYTADFHRTTLTNGYGVEAIVRNGKVEQLVRGHGSTLIPHDGYVLSASGNYAAWALRMLLPKAQLELKSECLANEGGNDDLWRKATGIVTGWPRLLRGGQMDINLQQEGVSVEFAETWHPRTAIGRLSDGRILLLTVDGRQPTLSSGMSLVMLAKLLEDYGAIEALNLDGGGSTTMFIRGVVVNSPSDKTGERPVSDALLLFPRHSNLR